MGQTDALEALKNGDIAATVMIAGKPAPAMARLRAMDGFRFLRIPFAKQLQDEYLPAALTNADYPSMLPAGEGVDTVAVGAVLIAYNWPKGSDRYRRIAKFVDEFFPKIAEFQKAPRHPKWRETNLASTLPGWTRFPAAEEWLAKNRPPPVASARDQFNEFMAARGGGLPATASSAERERFFQDFLKWSQTR